MKEITGNMFDMLDDFDAMCITTNGKVTNKGKAVMGAGCALEARQRFPGMDEHLGRLINQNGNVVNYLGYSRDCAFYSFPTKHHWKQKSSIKLIKKSCKQLVDIVDANGYDKVLVPRPGCSNGQLKWEIVKPIVEKYFDDRFTIISK